MYFLEKDTKTWVRRSCRSSQGSPLLKLCFKDCGDGTAERGGQLYLDGFVVMDYKAHSQSLRYSARPITVL